MSQSYSNHPGSGVRAGYVVVTTAPAGPNGLIQGPEWHLVDGDNTSNNQCFFNSNTVSGSVWIKFDFRTNRVIDEAKFYQQNTSSHGTWKWQGSTDNSNWTDIGSSFTLGGTATQTQTSLNGNTTAYRWYRLLGVSGSTSTSPWVYEFEFRIDSPPTDAISYANSGGEGNRGTITATTDLSLGGGAIGDLLNGNLVEHSLWFTNGGGATGKFIKFDFGASASKIITEATFFFSDSNQTHGTWKWQGSNDNSNWTDIGSSFTLGASPSSYSQIQTQLSGNSTGYRYYRLLGISGSTNSTPWIYEMAFQIGDASGHTVDVGQVSETDTAQSMSHSRSRTLGQASETDSVNSVNRILGDIVTQVIADVIGENGKDRVTQTTADVIGDDGKSRVTQTAADVVADGEFVQRITQIVANVIADVAAHTPNVRATQVILDVIGVPRIFILTPSPLLKAWRDDPYIAHIRTSGGLGAVTFSLESGPILGATQTNPVVITVGSPADGQRISITGVVGMTQLNGNTYYVNELTPTTFALYNDAALTSPVNGTGYGAYVSGGTWTQVPPAGFTLDAATGEIAGPFTETGTFFITIRATDAAGSFAVATYLLVVDSLEEEAVNLGIGVFGLGYTIARGLSGVEAHIEMIDVGLGTVDHSAIYNRSWTSFPRPFFPADQLFYLELVGSNGGATDVDWTVTSGGYSQALTQPAGQFGRLRNAIPFDGPGGLYQIVSPPVASLNDAVVTQFRIVAPLRRTQKFMSEVRLTYASNVSASDQTIGGPDLFRTSSSGHEGVDDGWVPTNQPIFLFEAATWEPLIGITMHIVMANASFDPAERYSEIALVDLDDLGEFGFSQKVSSKNINIFLDPTYFSMPIYPADLRDGHRYQLWARSVKPDSGGLLSRFPFNTYLHTARLHLFVDQGNRAEVYNRCGPEKRVYLPGWGLPIPEIYFQVQADGPNTVTLKDMGASTVLANSNPGAGIDVPGTTLTSAYQQLVRSGEISELLQAGHDYHVGTVQGELVYRFSNVVRRRSHNYMF